MRCRRRQQIEKNNIVSKRKMRAPIPTDEYTIILRADEVTRKEVLLLLLSK